MKTTTLLACGLAAVLGVLPSAAKAQAPAQEISFDFFYNSLSDDGSWYNTSDYGYVWQPDLATKENWRPYTDGYWAQTEDGWTWVSYESFGWATYHYGRWTRLKDIGWAWVPGYEWGPGWVSWRNNDEYVGWAPLPPKRERVVYEGRVADERPAPEASVSVNYNDVEEDSPAGYTPAVDEQYDIGPQNYCFVQTRSFGAPVLREVILPPQQNFVYVQNTVNVTNITYNRVDNRTVIYNNGPDYALLSRQSERPIQQLHLERRNDLAFVQDGIRGGNNPTLVRGGVLQVASPMVSRTAVNFQQVKPARVKETIAHTEVVRGWQGVTANPQQVAQLHDRIKENATRPPPPAAANREVFQRSPAAKVSPQAPGPVPGVQEPGRAERQANLPPGAPANGVRPGTAPVPPNVGGVPTDADRLARQREREQRNVGRVPAQAPGAVPPAAAAAPGQPGANPARTREEKRAAKQQAREQAGQVPGAQQPPPGAPQAPAGQQPPAAQPSEAARTAQERQDRRAARQQQGAAPGASQPTQPNPAADAEKQQRRLERQQQKTAPEPQQPKAAPEQPRAPAAAPNPQADQERQQRRLERQQQRAQEAPGAQQAPRQEAVRQPQSERPQPIERPQREERAQPAPQPQREARQQAPQQPQREARPQAPQQPQRETRPQAGQEPRAQQGRPEAKGKDDDKKKDKPQN